MAGRKQHYIPQDFQKAFEASRKGKHSQVYVFRKGKPAYLTSTQGAGAERDFYSIPSLDGGSTLDDKITDFESDYLVPILTALRTKGNGRVDADLAATVVTHLALRTAHIRGSMAVLMGSALEQMKSMIDDAEVIRRFTEIDSLSPDTRMTQSIQEELSKFNTGTFSEEEQELRKRIIAYMTREKFDNLYFNSKGTVAEGIVKAEPEMTNTIANAHARVLSDTLLPKDRLNALQAMDWNIVEPDEGESHFILPDCVVVASTKTSEDLKPFWMLSVEEAELVVIPLSPRQILIGSSCRNQSLPTNINAHLAKCSLDFFISSKQDQTMMTIAETIGTCANGLNLDLLEEEKENSAITSHTQQRLAARLAVKTPSGRFGELAKKTISIIAKETLQPETFNFIESIRVPANMQAALANLLKRDPTASELQSVAFGATEPLKAGNEWKCQIIIPRDVVEMLVQNADLQKQLFAAYVLRLNLGRAYYFDCWLQRCPEIFEPLVLDAWDNITFKVMSRVGAFYFGGIAAGQHESKSQVNSLNQPDITPYLGFGLSSLQNARQQFFIHHNVDQLLNEAVQAIETILYAIAPVCGTLEANDIAIDKDSITGTFLANKGLWGWIRLMAKDLRRHYDKRHQWLSVADICQLGCHIERLLWTIGVIAIQTDSGLRIIVQDDEQMADLKKYLEFDK